MTDGDGQLELFGAQPDLAARIQARRARLDGYVHWGVPANMGLTRDEWGAWVPIPSPPGFRQRRCDWAYGFVGPLVDDPAAASCPRCRLAALLEQLRRPALPAAAETVIARASSVSVDAGDTGGRPDVWTVPPGHYF